MFPESFLSLHTKPCMCVCCIVANTSLCTHINVQVLFYSNGPIATLIATSKAVEFHQHTCRPVRVMYVQRRQKIRELNSNLFLLFIHKSQKRIGFCSP